MWYYFILFYSKKAIILFRIIIIDIGVFAVNADGRRCRISVETLS